MDLIGQSKARPIAMFVLVAIATRLLTVGNPVVHVDEEFYLAVANAMWRGALPFVDIWDRKPIGLFLLYLPAAAFPFGTAIYVYQLMAAASVVLTALVIHQIARRAGWRRGAELAGVAYIVWLIPLGGMGGQAPIFYDLLMAGAAYLIIVADRSAARRYLGTLAMLMVGVALQVKYSVVYEGIGFGLWLLRQEWRATRSPGAIVAYAIPLMIVALIPTAIALGYYAYRGATDDFIFANFLSILHRNGDSASEIVRNVGTLLLILSPIVAMAFLGAIQRGEGEAETRHFLLSWLVVSLVAVASFSPWFDHYGLPVLVPATACCAAFFSMPGRRRVGIAVIAAAAIIGQITIIVNKHNRGTAAQFAEVARQVGRGAGCLWVYAGSTALYEATGRCFSSKYVVPAHLNRLREKGAVGIDQRKELDRIFASRPAVIVIRPPFRGEDGAVRAAVLARVERDYRLASTPFLGREKLAVYKAR